MRESTILAGALLTMFAAACSDSNNDDGDPGPDTPDSGVVTDTGVAPDAGPQVVGMLTVDVTGVFSPGDQLTDAYTGRPLMVGNDGKVEVPYGPNKVALLERATTTATIPFSWDNATVYFMMTDRFENGDTSNDDNFGRASRTADGQSVGTWHGGDFAGIVQRLDYIEALGVDAIWITPPVEQIRGWVGGGAGDFQHFPYHGYWAGDFTKLDPNYGTEDDLRNLVSEAHARGIRVLFDVVINHPGYLNIYEASLYVPAMLTPTGIDDWRPSASENWQSFNNTVMDYTEATLTDWWGPEWVRAGNKVVQPPEFPGYLAPGGNSQTELVASLPDFLTASDTAVSLPQFIADGKKPDTNVVEIPGASVRDYLIAWHTRWVRDFGIDGFRADTVKHVDQDSWLALKEASVQALADWKAANPNDALDDLDFWMVGEIFPPAGFPSRPSYFTEGGFDALINFDFQGGSVGTTSDYGRLETFYSNLADDVASPTRQELTYASSHDTTLFVDDANGDIDLQFRLAQALLMMPGAVQIYYGDESARPPGPDVTDGQQKTRSDMNWDEIDNGDRDDLIAHWRAIGQFRRRHRAVGAGAHTQLTTDNDEGYAFARTYVANGINDKVVVVLAD